MSLYYLVGPKLNHLTRAASVTVATGAEDPLYPLTYLYDDQPGVPFRFNALVANSAVKCDLDLLGGTGNFTTWVAGPLPTGWTGGTSGTGSITQLSPGKDGTGSAVRLNGGASGSAHVEKTYVARAGEMTKLDDLLAFQVAASGSVTVTVKNQNTGNYWTGSVWTATPTAVVTQGSTAWATKTTAAFQIEAFGGSNPERPTILVQLFTSSNANCDVDDLYIYPGVSFASFHGHNFDSVAPTLNHSTDNFAGNNTQLATFTIARPSFFTTVAMTYKRWWAFTLLGTNQAKPYIGEFILGQYQTAARGAIDGIEVKPTYQQFRDQTAGGNVWTAPMTQDEQHLIHLPFEETVAESDELRNEWLRRSQGGHYPMVLVPFSAEAGVYHGKIDNSLAIRRMFPGFVSTDLGFTENPLPTFVG